MRAAEESWGEGGGFGGLAKWGGGRQALEKRDSGQCVCERADWPRTQEGTYHALATRAEI